MAGESGTVDPSFNCHSNDWIYGQVGEFVSAKASIIRGTTSLKDLSSFKLSEIMLWDIELFESMFEKYVFREKPEYFNSQQKHPSYV